MRRLSEKHALPGDVWEAEPFVGWLNGALYLILDGDDPEWYAAFRLDDARYSSGAFYRNKPMPPGMTRVTP